MFFMRAAVIGLGVEGKKAVNALLKHGWDVYASDLNSNIDLSDLELPGISLNFLDGGETFSIVSDSLTLDLGFTNSQAIDECDAIAISPSMFGGSFANKLLREGNLLSDVVSKHKKILTIGITGTNGKTTTVHMLKAILENAGKKVLVGGNGGGGFSGYYDLMLEAENGDYDIVLVEVCDMTLDFCENYQNEIEQACDGDRMELIVNDGKIASLLLIRDGGKWYITESRESGSINTNIKNKIEHFEYLDEKFGLTLQKFSVRVIDENSLDLFCEVLAMNGEVSEDGFNIEVAIYDADDNIVKLDSISRYDNDFKGFEVFHFGPIKLDISVEEISKIRIYPTR